MSAQAPPSISTPTGSKKDVSGDMPQAYHPTFVEEGWQAWWEHSGFYKPEARPDGEPFVMIIPPPNVTGTLHLGHALMVTIEDAMARWHRMCGKQVLWVPGTDHAGIATQVVVEKKLWKYEGKTRHDLGREKFLEEIWKWKEVNGNYICRQLRLMGGSTDWDREFFTMDEHRSVAVKEAFIRMFKSGKIYRANRLVNWSSHLLTAISDIEVDYITLDKPTHLKVPGHDKAVEFGVFHSFAYRLEGSDDPNDEITVATTRIETMIGDVAVAVHSKDERYKRFHGKFLSHPFIPERRIAVIVDDVLVDMEKGTGAVKVTPAHDPNDFACGTRHNLEQINVFTPGGAMTDTCGEFAGMMRFDARKMIVKRLDELGFYRGCTPNPGMRLGICSRSKDVIEPLLKPQWWVDCKDMAKRAADSVRNSELELLPKTQEKVWFQWLDNVQDWCISRQLWWGHRIPAYNVRIEGEEVSLDDCDMKYWIVAESLDEAQDEAFKRFPDVDSRRISVVQDEDVLDTWFSSALLPFSAFGWPRKTPDLARFFPNSLLETGGDILFFWVARMVMMGLELTDQLPFKQVFLHPMVRDSIGRKMSKSLGNVVDPLDVVSGISLEDLHAKLLQGNLPENEVKKAIAEQKKAYGRSDGIPECGTDGLRFGLLSYTAQGRNINMDVYRVQGYRQFCNKLWNSVRYCMPHFLHETFEVPDADALNLAGASLFDSWIISRLHRTIDTVNSGFAKYEFSAATHAIYTFMLESFCSVYLEVTKPILSPESTASPEAQALTRSMLYICIDCVLKMLHPMMPFVTEELWQRLPGRSADDTLMLARYPTQNQALLDTAAEAKVALAQDTVHSLLSSRAALGLTPAMKPDLLLASEDEESRTALLQTQLMIQKLAGTVGAELLAPGADVPAGFAPTVVNEHITAYLLVKDLINFEKELARLEKKKQVVLKSLSQLQKKVSSAKYIEKSPVHIKQKDNASIASAAAEVESFEASIASLRALQLSCSDD